MSLARQPTARLPSFIGLGKVPSAIMEYRVLRESPVVCSTSGRLRIVLFMFLAQLGARLKKFANAPKCGQCKDGRTSNSLPESRPVVLFAQRRGATQSTAGKPRLFSECPRNVAGQTVK